MGFRVLTAALAALLLTATTSAQTSAPDAPGYAMPETEVWELSADSGDEYQIFVSRPKGPPPEHGYPVLYVLDGNAIFASFAEARRIQERSDPDIAGSLIVAIGYETEHPYDTRRLYDFTPPTISPVPAAQARLAHLRSGGQEVFLDFLLERLRPEVARRYSVDPERQALFGHSLGGLFALHTLYTRPDAFHAIIAASPALWWNEQSILAEERAFAERLSSLEIKEPVSRLLVLVGENEDPAVMVWDAEALARRLEPLSAFGLRSRFDILDDETHASVPSRAVTTALRFAFSAP